MFLLRTLAIAGLTLFVFGLIGLAGERFEGRFFPVVKPAVMMDVDPGGDEISTWYDFRLVIDKTGCDYRNLRFVAPDGQRYPYEFRGRRVGSHLPGVWSVGPYRIHGVTPTDLVEMRMIVQHHCGWGRWWWTTTDMTPEW